jgi:hypothetical protein
MRKSRQLLNFQKKGNMNVYLASPNTQQQAEHAAEMPVLLSYAIAGLPSGQWVEKYQQTFSRILIDSGAYSEFNSGKKVDLDRYAEWADRWIGHADAIAGLDDISGDWRQSIDNYERFPLGFPTFHESDPYELLPDLIAMAQDRNRWLGIGLLPPRDGKERWMRETLDRIPENIHVHGWACRGYTHLRRLDSVDSTNWWRDAMLLRTVRELQHLTYGECLEIIVKRYKRWTRTLRDNTTSTMALFDNAGIN